MEINTEEKVQKARYLRSKGYNCAQAVFMAYSDILGLDENFAATIAAPLGGGMGQLREVCGTVGAMTLLAGMIRPASDPSDKEAKSNNYALVRKLAGQFREQNGSIVCRELLALPNTARPGESYIGGYQRKPCIEYIECAARIVGEEFNNMPKK